MCTARSFDASLDCEKILLSDSLQKVVETLVSLTLVDSSKNFLSGCTNNKSELSFVTPTGLPGEAVESISGYARSYIGLAEELCDLEQVFPIVSALCVNLLRLSSPEKMSRACVS